MKAFFIDRYGKQNGRIGEVPEPATLGMIAAGLLGLHFFRRKKLG